jgi:hypothetical protein
MPGMNLSTKTEFIRVSAISEFIRCPRKYFYHYMCNMVPPGERLPLSFGEALHAGIGWLLGHPEDIHGAYAAFRKVWTDQMESQMDKNRNEGTAVKLLGMYIDTHKKGFSIYEPLPPPPKLPGSLGVEDDTSDYEIPFAVDIGAQIPLLGRMDGIARHRDTGELWILEFKTASTFSARLNFFDSFELNKQVFCYHLAAKALALEEYYGAPLRGTIIERFTVDYKKPDIAAHPVYVQPHMLEDMLKLIRLKIAELLALQERGDFYKTWNCTPYDQFGQTGFMCDYKNLCVVPDWTMMKDIFVRQTSLPFDIEGGQNG